MEVRTFCRVCNAMCGLVVSVDGDAVTRVRGDDDHELSRGYTCPKGRALGDLHHDPRRLDHPLVRGHGGLSPVPWDAAIDDIAARIATDVQQSGPDSVAMYLASGSAFDSAGRRAAERFLSGIGSKQKYTATTIDTPSKPLIAELVGGWSGLTPIWDHASSQLLILFGSNPVISHGHSNAIPDPVRRLREFRASGGAVWVIDPRRTETAALADQHLQIRPGSDWLILGWLVRRLLDAHPAARTLDSRASGVDPFINDVAGFTDEVVTARCDIPIESLEVLLSTILEVGRVSALTGTGVSMSHTANITEYLLWALLIVTDSLDRRGGMWFNPGYLSRLDQRRLPRSDGGSEPGPRSRPELPRRFGEYPCAALVTEIEAGNVTTLLVVGGNPVTAFPDRDRTVAALSMLTTLVVIDLVPTETTELATHVLPAVDQLERADLTWLLDAYQLAVAAQHTDAVVTAIGERKPLWWMFGSIGERLGIEVLPGAIPASSASDETILARLIDRSVDPGLLRSAPSLAVRSGAVHGWVSEAMLPDGKWRLSPDGIRDQLRRAFELLDGPSLTLVPRRRMRLMNSQFRELSVGTDDAAIHAAPELVDALGNPVRATLSNGSGSITGRLVPDATLRDDCVTLTHGWTAENVCTLTSADQDIDPLTGMVLQSGLEVSIRAVD